MTTGNQLGALCRETLQRARAMVHGIWMTCPHDLYYLLPRLWENEAICWYAFANHLLSPSLLVNRKDTDSTAMFHVFLSVPFKDGSPDKQTVAPLRADAQRLTTFLAQFVVIEMLCKDFAEEQMTRITIHLSLE